MKHLIILLALYFFATPCIAQSDDYFKAIRESGKLYDSGVKAFAKKDYDLADSLFEKSIQAFPHKDTYYNRAVTKKVKGDEQGFAQNLLLAMQYGDTAARRIFYSQCTVTDTFLLTAGGKAGNPSSYDHMLIFRKAKTIKYQEVIKKDRKNNTLIWYSVQGRDTVYNAVEDIAITNETYLQLETHIRRTLSYPSSALAEGVVGTVFLQFVIRTDGSISNLSILRSPDIRLTAAATRCLFAPIKYTPLKIDGKPVNLQVVLPINFSDNRR